MVEGAPVQGERTKQNGLDDWDRNYGKKFFVEEDDEVSYTRVGRFGVKGD